MDWLNEAALRLREWLMQQVWLEGWQSSIAQTPDWALVTACPGFALLLALLLWAQAPRSKRAAKHAEPETSPSKPQAEARAETTAASAAAATSSAQEAPEPATTTMRAARGEATRRVAQTEAQATIPVRRASGVPSHDEQERKARVFLSSTFRDMTEERKVLAKETFPALKREFRKRGVEVQEVDLRWGVNEGDPTLDICLAAVKRSNWFVGLIGQRYGTTEDDEAKIKRLAERYPSIREGLGRSLTELEILEGVLANGPGDKQVLFFERDPAWLDELSPSRRGDYEDPPPRAELNDLARRIQERVGAMHVYASPGDIDVVFKAKMTEALEKAFPPLEGVDDPFMQEHRLHAAYARERLEPYIADDDNLSEINDWMANTGAEPKLIVGEPGGGKSALIANWTTSWARAHPTDIIFVHYLGASPDSANPAALVRRLWLHLNRVTGEDVAVPGPDTKIDDLRDLVSDRLAQTNAFAAREGCRIVTVLDGLDKLSEEHRDLRWWPRALPPGIKVLASSLDGKARDAARERDWSELAIKPFDAAQKGAFIAKTLEGWEKSDFPDLRKQLVLAHKMAGLPLFLKTILEELRVSAEHAELEDRLGRYLTAQRMPDLFKQILAQIETECGKDFVAHALSLIWAGRAGLEEDEIIAITGATNLDWERLRNRLADNLRDTQGRVTFSHDYLRQAVEAAYFETAQDKQKAHLLIADRFQAREPDARQAEELPYQLRAAEAWERLEALLVDLDRFDLLLARGDVDLMSYWLPLKERGRDAEALLLGTFEKRVGDASGWALTDLSLLSNLLTFLSSAGGRSAALLRWGQKLVVASDRLQGQDHANTLGSVHNLALTHFMNGEFDLAQALQETLVEARTRTEGPEGLATLSGMEMLALTLSASKDFDRAQALLEQVLLARTRILGSSNSATLNAMHNLALTQKARGNHKGARALFERLVEARSHQLGPQHRDTLRSMAMLASTSLDLGQLKQAHELNWRVIREFKRSLGPNHPDTLGVRRNQTLVFAASYELCRRAKGAMHRDTLDTMNTLAEWLVHLGELDKVVEVLKPALDSIGAAADDDPLGVRAIETLANTIGRQGDYPTSRALLERVVSAKTRLHGAEARSTLASTHNLANAMWACGNLKEARDLQTYVVEAMARALQSDDLLVKAARGLLSRMDEGTQT